MSATLVAAEDRILEGLSDAQREAVLHGDGPLLIVAGPGPARPRCSPGGSRT
jgi:DNA helicase-2/ATP-dependent DNA helicase PcrA